MTKQAGAKTRKPKTRPESAGSSVEQSEHITARDDLKFDLDEVADLLRENRGSVAATARMLGASRTTIHSYLDKVPELATARKMGRKNLVGELEDEAVRKALDPVDKDQARMIELLLKTHGREDGYGERLELTGRDGSPLEMVVRRAELKDLTPDEIVTLYRNSILAGHNE